MSPHEHAGHEHAGHAHDEHDHDELDACIEACLQCHVVCTMTAQYCLAQGGDHAAIDLVGVLLDCAQICQTSADFMVRGSPYHSITCGACAAVCRGCAEACGAIEGSEEMAHCAEVCAACAESCERMAAEEDEEDEA